MATQTIDRIGPLSMAKVMGVLYVVIGLFFGALISLASVMGAAAAMGGGADRDMGVFGIVFGVGAIVIFPLFYGVMGFIGGLILGALYNLVAKVAGGIEIELS